MSQEKPAELDPGWMVLLGVGLGATGGLLLLKRHVVLGGISLLTGAFLGVRGQEMREGHKASSTDTEPQAPPAKLEAVPAPSTGVNGKEKTSAVSSTPKAEKKAKKGGTSESGSTRATTKEVTSAPASKAAPKQGGTSSTSSKSASKKSASKKGGTSKATADDLQEVKGIGQKTVTILNAAGIRTFAELAATDGERLKEILQEAGLRMANPEGWPEQAAALAKG
jgi:predicted flap endonuclease-1-like 5' DNA nuclease